MMKKSDCTKIGTKKFANNDGKIWMVHDSQLAGPHSIAVDSVEIALSKKIWHHCLPNKSDAQQNMFRYIYYSFKHRARVYWINRRCTFFEWTLHLIQSSCAILLCNWTHTANGFGWHVQWIIELLRMENRFEFSVNRKKWKWDKIKSKRIQCANIKFSATFFIVCNNARIYLAPHRKRAIDFHAIDDSCVWMNILSDKKENICSTQWHDMIE